MPDRSPNPHPGTIGFLEQEAGIGPTHDERFAFWRQFSHLGSEAFDAAVTELQRRVAQRRADEFPMPDPRAFHFGVKKEPEQQLPQGLKP